MAGSVGGSGDISTSSPLTDQPGIESPAGNNGAHNIHPTEVPNHLSGLEPDGTSRTPIGERSSTPVDTTSTPGLSKPSDEEKDLPTLEKERAEMLKEAGEVMANNEELLVLAHALRAVAAPGTYEDNLDKPKGLKVTLQLAPNTQVYTLEPPDEAFKALPPEHQEKMKAMAYDLLMNHNNTKFKDYDLRASKERLNELKEKLEKNGEEIAGKNGENNWRASFETLEHRPAYIITPSDDAYPNTSAIREKDEPEKLKPSVKVEGEIEPETPLELPDDEPENPISSDPVLDSEDDED